MRPMLFFAILKAKQYKKKHNLPDYLELTDEMLQKRIEENAKPEYYDCFSADKKYREGLKLEKIALPDCGAP